MTRCPACGAELQIGSWPFCPDHRVGSLCVVPDSIPGGETSENMGHSKVTYYSRSERKRILAERGLVEKVRHVGVPGSDRSPRTQRFV